MVVKEFLDSDRVNFLIWRYLVEGNYRETAAKLQKEWHIKEPHRDFPFARHVKGHALVNVINRGLLYNGLEREHARHKLPQDAAAETDAQVGIFGPLEPHSPAKVEDDHAVVHEGSEESRKRLQNHLSNGSPAKRPRLSNGFDGAPAAAGPGMDTTTPMDVDHQAQDNHAYPSPGEAEPVSAPVVRTEGPDQGTQVEKVEELLPNTTFLKLVEDDATAAAPASEATATPSSSPAPTGENAPVLLQCEWSPRDPSLLAAAGTDALARVWSVSRATAAEVNPDHVSPQFHAMLDRSTPKSTTVTALSWASDGDRIAIATDAASKSVISIWGLDGTLEQEFEITDLPVLKLSWNPSNTAILAISPDKTGAMVAAYSLARSAQHTYSLPGYDNASSLDATWTSDNDVLLCGGDMLTALHCSEQGIVQSRKFETRPEDSFRHVLFDWRSKLAATSSEKGNLDLWDEFGQRREISAHRGAITTMAWQPLPPTQVTNDEERLIATGGEDCAILIWNARRPETKAMWFRTMDGPIVKLAFTPDGAFIAGATATKVLIWKVGNYNSPRAIWTRPATSGWMSPKTTSDTDEEDEICLCWDASGQKLAYGASSKPVTAAAS